jgi:hypothetical protein
MESTTLQATLDDPSVRATRDRERAYFTRRWGADLERDRFHNANLDVRDENLRVLLTKPRCSPELSA